MAVVKRLSKVARELNVGISTIVEFLGSQGKEVSSNPNTKIGEELYMILLEEYQKEKFEKEKADNVVIDQPERKVISIKKEEPKKEVEKIVAKADLISRPSVLGKIDLSPKQTKPEPVKEEKKEEKTPESTNSKNNPSNEEIAQDSETIKAEAKKLSGPKVLGKIELPKVPEKTKPISANDSDSSKRKRKRIKKVNVEKAGKKVFKDQRKKTKSPQKTEASPEEIQKEIKETLARLSNKGKSKSSKLRREKRQAISDKMEIEELITEHEKSTLKLTEFVSVSELASMMSKSPNDVIGTLMSIGIFASINQRLDAETLTMVAEEFGFTVEFVSADVTASVVQDSQNPENMQDRPPIVTVMGHVDHGKTSLLDYIRSADVTSGEAGGITQHIGAYSVKHNNKLITFLDTPGHEAFTAMRARGAQVTDVSIIIIAADDRVMPQTKEAINHSQAAGVPMVFALNKCDMPTANPDKIKEELSAMNILVEDWGGKYQCQEISAKDGNGIDELLEKVLLESELLELKADPDTDAKGTVIEASLDKGRGYVTTLLVQYGTMKVGDTLIAGKEFGKIKAMQDESGKPVESAGPSRPVSVLGMNGAASAGDIFNVLEDEKEMKQIASKRQQLQREQGLRTTKHITLDEIGRRIALGDFQELNVIVKGDVDGSIEALSDSLLKLSQESIQINIIHKAVGQITESDILLASASDAIVIGFQVRPSAGARKLAEKEEIDIRLYSIIYKAIEEIKEAMEGMLSPEFKEEIVGTAEIRETFKITKFGTIAGCYVTDGRINRNHQVRIIREGIVVYSGELGSLKRFKDDVKEVKNGYECGLNIAKYNDIKVGDVVEAYEEVEVNRKL
ncbi:MAG: translation initiation factor IF-2 [Crocinitomicaceae bacterium]|nr:translation initiation factor IF-2 [Crocinitomicaceae bacterium]|tara:strand:+ start:525 stop:3077 length:2553 start_codon:yes stop_codon:yes gene_type:complete